MSSDYGAVIEHLSASQMKADGMRRWLQALQLCVSRLGREHDQLVSATLVRDLTWWTARSIMICYCFSRDAEVLLVQSEFRSG